MPSSTAGMYCSPIHTPSSVISYESASGAPRASVFSGASGTAGKSPATSAAPLVSDSAAVCILASGSGPVVSSARAHTGREAASIRAASIAAAVFLILCIWIPPLYIVFYFNRLLEGCSMRQRGRLCAGGNNRTAFSGLAFLLITLCQLQQLFNRIHLALPQISLAVVKNKPAIRKDVAQFRQLRQNLQILIEQQAVALPGL